MPHSIHIRAVVILSLLLLSWTACTNAEGSKSQEIEPRLRDTGILKYPVTFDAYGREIKNLGKIRYVKTPEDFVVLLNAGDTLSLWEESTLGHFVTQGDKAYAKITREDPAFYKFNLADLPTSARQALIDATYFEGLPENAATGYLSFDIAEGAIHCDYTVLRENVVLLDSSGTEYVGSYGRLMLFDEQGRSVTDYTDVNISEVFCHADTSYAYTVGGCYGEAGSYCIKSAIVFLTLRDAVFKTTRRLRFASNVIVQQRKESIILNLKSTKENRALILIPLYGSAKLVATLTNAQYADYVNSTPRDSTAAFINYLEPYLQPISWEEIERLVEPSE